MVCEKLADALLTVAGWKMEGLSPADVIEQITGRRFLSNHQATWQRVARLIVIQTEKPP